MVKKSAAALLFLTALAGLSAGPRQAPAQTVATYHGTGNRHGVFTVPGLTDATAARIHLEFRATLSGNVYAQPLYWQSPEGKAGLLIVATESNIVYALNPNTGARVWQTQLGKPVPGGIFPCGNISPEGVTGTPVIDPASGRLYLDATTLQGVTLPRHMIYALNLSNGKIVPHWPLNVDDAMALRHAAFDSDLQGERSALQFFKSKIYITYGGRAGDCGSPTGAIYRGVAIEVTPAATPKISGSWETRAARGGIWSQGGTTSDGSSLYVTTGNTSGANSWGDGEAVIRLMPGLARSAKTADLFTPSNWKDLDNQDADLGGTAAFPFPVNTSSGEVGRLLGLGKDGHAYLLDAANLGGDGHELLNVQVSNSSIITGPAAYLGPGATWVAFTNLAGLNEACSGTSITALRITAKPDHIATAWCAPIIGSGAPIITTSDGTANPIVWATGAGGDSELHGFSLLNGKLVFNGGGTVMSGLHPYGTLIATNRHLYVAGDNTLYAFTF
jgi:hypothetical protein